MRVGKEFTLFFFKWRFEWYYYNRKVIKRFGYINWWSYWNSKTRNKKKKKEGGFLGALLAPLAASIVQPVISSVVKDISGGGVRRAGRRLMSKNLWFRSIL